MKGVYRAQAKQTLPVVLCRLLPNVSGISKAQTSAGNLKLQCSRMRGAAKYSNTTSYWTNFKEIWTLLTENLQN